MMCSAFIAFLLTVPMGNIFADFTPAGFHQTTDTFMAMTDPAISREKQAEKAAELKQQVAQMALHLKKVDEAKSGADRLAENELSRATLALLGAFRSKVELIKKSDRFCDEAKDAMTAVHCYYDEVKNLFVISNWSFSDTKSIQNVLCAFVYANHFRLPGSSCPKNSIESCAKIQGCLLKGYIASNKEVAPLLSESILIFKHKREAELLGGNRSSTPGLAAIDDVFDRWNKYAVKYFDTYLDILSRGVLTGRLYVGALLAQLNITVRQKEDTISLVMVKKMQSIFDADKNIYSRFWYGAFNNPDLKKDAAFSGGLKAFIDARLLKEQAEAAALKEREKQLKKEAEEAERCKREEIARKNEADKVAAREAEEKQRELERQLKIKEVEETEAEERRLLNDAKMQEKASAEHQEISNTI